MKTDLEALKVIAFAMGTAWEDADAALVQSAIAELTAARAVIKQLSTLMIYLEYPYLKSLVREYDEVTK